MHGSDTDTGKGHVEEEAALCSSKLQSVQQQQDRRSHYFAFPRAANRLGNGLGMCVVLLFALGPCAT